MHSVEGIAAAELTQVADRPEHGEKQRREAQQLPEPCFSRQAEHAVVPRFPQRLGEYRERSSPRMGRRRARGGVRASCRRVVVGVRAEVVA